MRLIKIITLSLFTQFLFGQEVEILVDCTKCAGDFQLCANATGGSGNYTYTWTPAPVTGQGSSCPFFNETAIGVYQYEVEVSDGECIATDVANITIEQCACDCQIVVTKLDDCTLQACWSGTECGTINRWLYSADNDCENGNSTFGSSQSGPCTTLDISTYGGSTTGYFSYFILGQNGCDDVYGDCIFMDCDTGCDCTACSGLQGDGLDVDCNAGFVIADFDVCTQAMLDGCGYETLEIIINGSVVATENNPSCTEIFTGLNIPNGATVQALYTSNCGCNNWQELEVCGMTSCDCNSVTAIENNCTISMSTSGSCGSYSIEVRQVLSGGGTQVVSTSLPYTGIDGEQYFIVLTKPGCPSINSQVVTASCAVSNCGCAGSDNITANGCTISAVGPCGNGYTPEVINLTTNQVVSFSLPYNGVDGNTYFVRWVKNGCPTEFSNTVTLSCTVGCTGPNVTISGDCNSGLSLNIVGSCPGATYTWTYNGSQIFGQSGAALPASVVQANGNGTYGVTVNCSNGCGDSDTHLVSNCPTVSCGDCDVVASYSPNNCTITYIVSGDCTNYELEIIRCGGFNPTCSGDACSGGGTIVDFQSPGWTGSDSYNITVDGSYSIRLFGNGCPSEDIDCWNVTGCAGCTDPCNVTTINNTTIDCGDNITLTTSGNGCGPFSYSWSGSDGSSYSIQSPTVSPTATTTYTVTMTDDNGDTCTDSVTITVEDDACYAVNNTNTSTGTTRFSIAGVSSSFAVWTCSDCCQEITVFLEIEILVNNTSNIVYNGLVTFTCGGVHVFFNTTCTELANLNGYTGCDIDRLEVIYKFTEDPNSCLENCFGNQTFTYATIFFNDCC